MKKKIAILGSTGSIGSTLLSLIDKKNYEIALLVANKNYKKVLDQAIKYNVKNIIITDYDSYQKSLFLNRNKQIKIYNNFDNLKNFIQNKLDYVMSSIVGIDGLNPTMIMIKFTKVIAIANKESLICAWPIINRQLKKYKTKFIPVDSEHFSIWSEIKDKNRSEIKKIYLTASGGPLLNFNFKYLSKVKVKDITKHPTWKMGKKISVDSATMMNKCFEVMEAKNIFNLNYKQIKIIIHPKSYVHAIIMYKNGISKIITHDTTMKIPIFNSLNYKSEYYKNDNRIDFKILNNLNFQEIKLSKFPIIRCLKNLPDTHSLYDTILVSINDKIVSKFLEKKIRFTDISSFVIHFSNLKLFNKYKNFVVNSIDDIIKLNRFVNSIIDQYFLKHND